MVADIHIPKPVKFNFLKHHRRVIFEFLESSSDDEMKQLYESANHNYIDIYTGELSPFEIASETIRILKEAGAFSPEGFKQWISTSGYRMIHLTDGSEWVVRQGVETNRYIHIHPAKTGPFSIRFKGATLKTLYCLKRNLKPEIHKINLKLVNEARVSIGLSPIKKLEANKGIRKCIDEFFKI